MPLQPLKALKTLWARWAHLGPAHRTHTPPSRQLAGPQGPGLGTPQAAAQAENTLTPYDQALLERARTQWQFGDWQALATMTHQQVQHHPDRAHLALLAAAGLQQLGRAEEAQVLTRQALDWGCCRRLAAQILISGVHNSLARARAILDQEQRAMKHFEAAIDTGMPHADRLVKAARVTFQLNRPSSRTWQR